MSASQNDKPQHVALNGYPFAFSDPPSEHPLPITSPSPLRPSESKRRTSLIDTESTAQAAAPFLAKHIPTTYSTTRFARSAAQPSQNPMTSYCNRHNPNAKCWKQADEPTMDELQKNLERLDLSDQQGISTVWSLFAAAPAKQRELMLHGILTVCCFPQLSFVSATIREMIKIDFLSTLPTELSFKILSYLDTTSLCKAAQVSQRWNQLAEDDVVWHKMCEQHIAKKCKRCGWGLPVPERKRLLKEKRAINERVAQFRGTPSTGLVQRNLGPGKRSAEDDVEKEDDATQSDKRQRLPWKEVYRNRFKVGSNWKHGRYSLRVLSGHKNSVMCVQFQDNILASGSYDATIKIWDLDTGEELRTLDGHASGVRCLQFREHTLFSGAMDKTIKVWNWQTGELLRTFHEPAGDVLSVHTVGNFLGAGGKDHNVRVWDFTRKTCHTLHGHGDFVNSVRLDVPSRTVFSASDDCSIRLWDLDTGAVLKTFTGHVGGVQQLVLLPEEFDLDEVDLKDCDHPSDTEDHNVDDRRFKATSPDKSLPNLPLFPNDPARKNPPQFMMTASLDSTIRLWHVPTAHCLRTFFGHLEGIWALVADNLRVISGAEDGMVKVWDPRSGMCERTYGGHSGSVTCLTSSSERLITGGEDHTIRVMEFGYKN